MAGIHQAVEQEQEAKDDWKGDEKVEKFGTLLKQVLKEKGMSQVKFANEIGVSPRSVRRWIGTDIIPTKSIMPKITEAIGIRMIFETGEFERVE